MYQALYRKYRSQTFGEMVGQEVVATTLRQAVEQEKISHAYLFSGPRGTGKTSAAKIFAKAMNCPNQVGGEPCNDCYICRAITEGSLEDVIEIDAASNNGVDEIRDIRDKSTYAPSIATYKVYIIDEVHMLSTGAFNALLKTLEEPTANVVFILATTELHKIPATVLSRVQRFEFKSIQTPAIQAHMEDLLHREGVSYEEGALDLIARRAEGGMRDALSILDQALSLIGDEGNLTISVAEEITGSISLDALDDYVAHVHTGQAQEALSDLQTIFESGKSMTRFATDLLYYYRDLLIVQSGGESGQFRPRYEENLTYSQEEIFAAIDQVTSSLQSIKQSAQPKIYAEMMTIRLSEDLIENKNMGEALSPSVQELIQQLQGQIAALQKEVESLKHQQPSSRPFVAEPVAKPVAQSRGYQVDKARVYSILQEAVDQPTLARENLIKLQEAWGEVIESLQGPDKALLIGSQPVAANEHHAILAFESAFNAGQTQKRSNLNTMFGNILSQAAGFSPEIVAVSQEDWRTLRAEFSARLQQSAPSLEEAPQEEVIPETMQFLGDQVTVVDD